MGGAYMLNLTPGTGDENLFISDLYLIESEGWIEAIKKNISIPHAVLVYPFSLIFKNYIALRFVNVLLLITLYGYFFFRNKPSLSFFGYLTFFLGTSKVFFIGTNDALFILGLVIFLNEVFKLTINEPWKPSLALCALCISIFTRSMFIVYLPILLLSVYLIIKHKALSGRQLVLPSLIFLALIICNVPSIQSNGRLSYDLKSPPQDLNVTWAQRQYLAQMMVNEGQLPNYSHPSFEETQAYIDTHGEDALPKTTLQGILFNPIMTVKEFFKDFFDICFFGFRQLGLLLFIPIGYLFFLIYRRKFNLNDVYVPISLVVMMSIFALIIISFIELRWLASIFVLAVVYCSFMESRKLISNKIFAVNQVVLLLLSCYGIYRILPKIDLF